MRTALAADFARKPLKILVCDDERYIVRLIQVNLERAGHTVITAFDGNKALQKIWQEKPDLVILDVMMPHMDGLEVLKAVRAEPTTMNLPVIVISQQVEDTDVFDAYHCGADMVLTKPFNPAELISFLGPLT